MLMEFINNAMPDQTDGLFVTSERHQKKLRDSLKSLCMVKKGIRELVTEGYLLKMRRREAGKFMSGLWPECVNGTDG